MRHRNRLQNTPRSGFRVGGSNSSQVLNRPQDNNLALYLDYKEVTGQRASLEQMISLLQQLNVNDVLRTIATINNRFCMNDVTNAKIIYRQQADLVKALFAEDFQNKIINSSFGSASCHIVFHRQQQLFVLYHALQECQYEGGLPWNDAVLHLFAEACLMANDLLESPPPDPEQDGNMELTKMILKLAELAVDNEPTSVIGRAVELWLSIPEEPSIRRLHNYTSFAAAFFEGNGIELDVFLRVLYTLMAQTMQEANPNELPWSQFVINVKTFFANTSYSEEVVRKVFSVLSCQLADIREIIPEHTGRKHGYEFAALERYPFIQVSDDLFVYYDKRFLLRFFTHGIWWRIHDTLPENQRNAFRQFFGDVFESYLKRVLSHTCSQSNRMHLYERLKFNSTDEICDALIQTDDAWVIIEAKASLLRFKSKYAGDTELLKHDIDERFFGTETSPKGARQLARSIRRLLVNHEQDTMRRLSVGNRQNIYPVLVSYDMSVCNKFVAAYLDAKLREELGDLPTNAPCVRPLTILSIADLESFSALGYRHLLPHLLASYRYYAAPLIVFKDHIFEQHSSDINVDRSYTSGNYTLLHELVSGDFVAHDKEAS